MISDETKTIIERSKQIYEQYRDSLEIEHRDQYVTIEPESGEYFLGDSFCKAVEAARKKLGVEIEFQALRNAAMEFLQLVLGKRVVQRKHRDRVPDCAECLDRFRTDTLRG